MQKLVAHKNIIISVVACILSIILSGLFFSNYFIVSPVFLRVRSPFVQRVDAKKYADRENAIIDEVTKWLIQYNEDPATRLDFKKEVEKKSVQTPEPKTQGKTEISSNSSTVASFPKYLNDEGAANREKALVWLKSKYSGDDLIAFDNILKKESGYRASAVNEIGAGGICQAYPAAKMGCNLSPDDLMCQLQWCDSYITSRYGSPTKAYQFHIVNNWF